MMRRLPLVALVLSVAALQPLVPAADAQISSRGLIDPAAARSIGLERMWFTQLSMDRSRSKLAGIHQRVSETEFRTIFEFLHGGVRRTFSARELEESGRPLRDVAVLAVLEEATPANPPAGQAPAAAKFKVVTVLKGPTIAQADQVLDLAYVGDARKGSVFLITGSELIPGAKPPAINWWMPLALTDQAAKVLAAADAYTAGADRALQHAEQELAAIRNTHIRLNPDKAFDDDSLPLIDGHVVPKITLYGASERGLVHALDGETGAHAVERGGRQSQLSHHRARCERPVRGGHQRLAAVRAQCRRRRGADEQVHGRRSRQRARPVGQSPVRADD